VAMDVREVVGRRVRELRLKVGLSQEELATRAGLHRNYTGRIERAEQDIGITALSQLVKALDISLAEFFAPFRHK
jgi:XRE family transcriptional regulator, regulator of sulfur utilization